MGKWGLSPEKITHHLPSVARHCVRNCLDCEGHPCHSLHSRDKSEHLCVSHASDALIEETPTMTNVILSPEFRGMISLCFLHPHLPEFSCTLSCPLDSVSY